MAQRRKRLLPPIELLEPRTLLAATLVKDINSNNSFSAPPYRVSDAGGALYFVSSLRLYRTDGTNAGTYRVSGSVWDPQNMADYNGTLVFNSLGGLWKSDGTDAGSVAIYPNSFNPRNITTV